MQTRAEDERQSEAEPPGDARPGPAGAPPPLAHPASTAWIRWFAALGWAAVLLVGAYRLSPLIALSPVAAYAAGFAAVALTAIATSSRCPARRPRALGLVVVPLLGLYLLSRHPPGPLELAVGVTVCLLAGGTLVGSVVGFAVEHPGYLVFVAIVSSAADVLSVFHPSGPSAGIAQSEVALSLLALPWPMLGTTAIESFLGVGDVVFTALYVASARRHGLAIRPTLLALTVGYAVTMVAVIALQVPVPALPFLGLAMVAAHPEARRPPPRDRKRGYLIAAVVVAVVAALLLM